MRSQPKRCVACPALVREVTGGARCPWLPKESQAPWLPGAHNCPTSPAGEAGEAGADLERRIMLCCWAYRAAGAVANSETSATNVALVEAWADFRAAARHGSCATVARRCSAGVRPFPMHFVYGDAPGRGCGDACSRQRKQRGRRKKQERCRVPSLSSVSAKKRIRLGQRFRFGTHLASGPVRVSLVFTPSDSVSSQHHAYRVSACKKEVAGAGAVDG